MDEVDSGAGQGSSEDSEGLPDVTVRAAVARDGDAFGRLWAALSPSVAAYFRAHAVDEADDLTSEVFLAAFRALSPGTESFAQFKGLVFRIAHRRYVDWVRRSVRRRGSVPYEPALDERCAASAEECVAELLGRERALALLELLTPDQREVITLRVFGDLSLQQTAEVLGRDVGTVKSLQHRGLARLRRQVDEEVSGKPYPQSPLLRWKARHV